MSHRCTIRQVATATLCDISLMSFQLDVPLSESDVLQGLKVMPDCGRHLRFAYEHLCPAVGCTKYKLLITNGTAIYSYRSICI